MPDALPVQESEAGWQKRGNALFTRPCTFLRAVSQFDQLTADDLPEVAFAGRSNVGKSSLINALTGRKGLARVSNTPGRTREIVQFDLDGRLRLADLPGYGFAKVSKAMSASWHKLINAYLMKRSQLRRVCLLIDARHPPQDSDLQMMTLLDGFAASYVVVLTKIDKLNAAERARAINDVQTLAAKHVALHPEVFATSAQDGEGLPSLRGHLARLALPLDKSAKAARRG